MFPAESGLHLIHMYNELDNTGYICTSGARLFRVIGWTTPMDEGEYVLPIVIERAFYLPDDTGWSKINNDHRGFVLDIEMLDHNNSGALYFSVTPNSTIIDIHVLANDCMKAAGWDIPLFSVCQPTL